MKRLAIDIETVPINLPVSRDSQGVSDEQGYEDNVKRLSLDATTARIVTVAAAAFDGQSNPLDLCAFYGNEEAVLLTTFWNLLVKHGAAQLVTHNGLNFDLPFIWRRSVILGVKPTRVFDLARFRTEKVFDTLQVWANWNPREFISLDNLAEALGVGHKSDSAANVYKHWLNGRFEDVARYCLDDALLTYACYSKMNFLPQPDLSLFDSFTRLVNVDPIPEPQIDNTHQTLASSPR